MSSGDAWLSLGAASRLVGVAPETLRRWADEGRVQAFVTPGGHRRFNRRSLETMTRIGAPPTRSPVRLPLARLGATPERLAAAYRRRYASSARLHDHGPAAGTPPPMSGAGFGHPALDPLAVVPAGDREAFRVEGRQLIAALVRHLDARPAAADVALDGAIELVQSLGARLASAGVSLTDAVTLFVAARQPFLSEIGSVGRRRALEPRQLADVYERASSALDRLLVVMVRSHRDVAGAPERGQMGVGVHLAEAGVPIARRGAPAPEDRSAGMDRAGSSHPAAKEW
jgi:excisionase family DNA binding protein